MSDVPKPIGNNPFGASIVAAVVEHMNLDHPEDSLLIVRALGARPDATAASTVGLDGDAIEFDVHTKGARERVRVPWSTPITERRQIRAEVTRMYYDACTALGVESRPAEEH
jgi:hypothetical protein